MNASVSLCGIYPALLSPFTQDGSFNFDMLRKLVQHLAKQKVRGFYIGGSSSELFALTMAERKKMMEIVREESGSCSVIAHIGAMSAADAQDLARHAKAIGCDAISAIPPFYGKYSWDETAAYYRGLIEAGDLPFFLYNIPAFTGVNLPVKVYKDLLATGRVAGIKHTSYNLFEMERLKAANPDGIVLIGHDEIFCPAAAVGADGIIGTSVNVFPEYYQNMDRYLKANNLVAARSIQSTLNALLEVFMEIGFFPSTKHVLKYRGFDVGDCRQPVLPIEDVQKRRLENAFDLCQQGMSRILSANPFTE
jgi:Dihydrodipicolinate synthase/N-acetylneuraminate lyase